MNNISHPTYIRENFSPSKHWGVFIDRDGTINKETHLIHKLEDLVLIPNAAQAIKLLNDADIPVIIIHNAAVVARGLCDLNQVKKLNQALLKNFASVGAWADIILFCPHHPQAYNADYKLDCSWRKPQTGMLTFVADNYKCNLKKSYVIGDSWRDIQAGEAVKANTILVQTGHAGEGKVTHPSFTAQDLHHAVKYIIKQTV